MITRVYLAGAVKHQDSAFQTWRDHATQLFENCTNAVSVVDPTRDFGYDQWNLPPTDRACLNMYMYKIKKSDVILVNLDNSDLSVGTGIEVHQGAMHKKAIVGFGSKIDSWYGWTAEECDVVFKSLREAVEYICIHYVG